jgi:hypothetical protein
MKKVKRNPNKRNPIKGTCLLHITEICILIKIGKKKQYFI